MPEETSTNDFFEAAANASDGVTTPVQETVTPATETIQEAPPAAEFIESAADVITEPTTTDTADTPVETTTNSEPEIIEEKVREVEKIVEKVVEKYPEFKSEKAKQLYEAAINGDDDSAIEAIIEYGREKKRDYTTMSDLDVLRTSIKKEKPHWSKDEIELKIAEDYGDELVKVDLSTIDKDIDPDEYKEAEKHNKQVDRNLLRIGRDAKDARQSLIEQQSKLELPKIEYKRPDAPVQEEPSAEAIAEANRIWQQQVEEQTKDFSDLSVRIGDRQVTYKPTEEDKQATVSAVKEFNPQKFFKERGWVTEDGQSDAKKIAEDLFWLTNKEKVINAYSSQAENRTKKEMLKEIKNVTPTTTSAPTQAVNFADAFSEAWEQANK